MKWIRWITNWFGGNTKSLGSLGIGLRGALGGVSPGGWASDHREETAHNTGFNYIAIHAIASQVAGATVTVFADGDQQVLRQSRRKSLAGRAGSFTRWKSTYGADDRETDPLPTTHPLVRLLRRPNPYESGASFRYRQAQQLRLTGTCLIWNLPSVSGPTCERYVIPTAMASPVPPTSELLRGGWRINPVASRYTPIVDDGFVECPSWYRILGQIIDARQVQVIRLPHAWYLDDGQSPLSAGAKWVDAGTAVDDARYHQLKNGIDPSVVWNLPPDVSPDQDEIDRVQAKISAKYGGPQNVGRVMVAQSGTSITPLSATPKEMCYTEGFQDFKAAVLALHQTPPVAVGLQEPGAYAAYNASMKAWRHSAIQPLCDMLAESDTEHLAPQFGFGLTVEIESDTVDDTDLVERQLQNDLAAKVRTKNEWRAVRGMPPLPGTLGDDLVGTDGEKHQDQSSAQSTKLSSTDDNESQAKSNRIHASGIETLNREISKTSVDSHMNSRSTSNDESDSNSLTKLNDDESKVELIAEILYGIYGDSALSIFDRPPSPEQKTFNEALHPRDDLGRFRTTRSEESIAEARQAIGEVLKGVFFGNNDERVLNSLRVLSRAQLESLHREYGVALPPKSRARLIESIRARLYYPFGGTVSDARHVVSRIRHPSNRVEVYVQNPSQLNALTHRPLSPEQWGQIVGAQSGARVYVHKYAHVFQTIHIQVIHADYSATRMVSGKTITNVTFAISPGKQGEGLGTQIFSQQVEAASKLGFTKILTSANGVGERLRVGAYHDIYSGYYAWARLGFDGSIAPLLRERLAESEGLELESVRDFRMNFRGVKKVSEMMLTKERREWWKAYGGYFEARFDLSRGSKCRQALASYLKELEQRQPSNRTDHKSTGLILNPEERQFHASFDQYPHQWPEDISSSDVHDRNRTSGEIPDKFTPEEEEILDQIWDQIGLVEGIHDPGDHDQTDT